MEYIYQIEEEYHSVCEPVANYSRATAKSFEDRNLFSFYRPNIQGGDIRVVELFAGVGGFRIGLERSSRRYKTIWNNQWEPSTKRQDASIVYCNNFGLEGHSNQDIATVNTNEIPEADFLVAGFPCQDYSVATTLKNSAGIEGKKGVLWWEIHRILKEMPVKPKCLFLENVDRLLKSPASQRGRDFAIILASLSDLGYSVEWRVINAADYGMPQRRRRTYMVAFLDETSLGNNLAELASPYQWIYNDGVIAKAFSCHPEILYTENSSPNIIIEGNLSAVSATFNKGTHSNISPFKDAGVMRGRKVWTTDVMPIYDGPSITLGDIVVPDTDVPDEYFIPNEELEQWKYLKGSKTEMRTTSQGYKYKYSEGAMTFPDSLDKPSRTIITGEGGRGASRFKHIILTPSGKYRRLIPVELERLNMFPDNHTIGVSDSRRAFLMGNALVTGIVERIGYVLSKYL